MSEIEKRKHVITLLEGGKHLAGEISKIVGASLSTVYSILSRWKKGISYERKKGSGRPSKTLPLITNSVAQQIRRTPHISLRVLADKCPVKTSKDTVARCLKKLNYTKPYPTAIPLLPEKNRLSRLEWARKNIHNSWEHAVFADEASIWICRGRIRMWTKGGSVRLRTTVKHSQKVHIWAAFSSMGTFPLYIFQENLTAQ